MSNKRITDLTELTTPTTDDVFPVVDIATNTTTKVQLGNLPVPTSVTSALATKENTITPGTTAEYFRGDKSFQTLDKTAVGLANVDNTSDANKPVSTAQQTALNAKQDTLVSGTNIKTLNSTSLLGSGNIVLTANPSGVSGAIQFSNGSAFASDAANFFWDDTNNRLGVGTNAPSNTTEIQIPSTYGAIGSNANLYLTSALTSAAMKIGVSGSGAGCAIQATQSGGGTAFNLALNPFGGSVNIGNSNLGASLGIKGSGSTSATTSLLVQNSAGTAALTVKDDLSATFSSSVTSPATIQGGNLVSTNNINIGNILYGSAFWVTNTGAVTAGSQNPAVASAIMECVSTTKGFLPPRMTTTQKNAIASPATGLVVYDSTTNKLCCYNGSTWNDLF